MQIGKNIYTNSKKKAYRKPVLEVVEVDNLIILQTGNSGGVPTDPPAVQSLPSTDGSTKTQPPSKTSNPFGGGTPDYER